MRKICAVTGYRSDYTKLKSVLFAIEESSELELEVVVFGAHALGDYGNTVDSIENDQHNIITTLLTNIEGGNTVAMSKSVGLAVVELSSVLSVSKPDVVLIVGDRYEIMAAAIASAMNNIPIAHIQGGEVSGTIDEVIRHSITKLANIHFPSTELSKNRILQMGENPEFVYNVGCPAIDYIKGKDYLSREEMLSDDWFKTLGLNFSEDYLILMQHPVTTMKEDFSETLEAVQSLGIQTIMIYPNPDAGGDSIVKAERKFSEKYEDDSVIVGKYKNIDFDHYLNLLRHCRCLVGNSSSGIREAYVFNTPVVNIGSRQQDRERTANVVDVPCDRNAIENAALTQMNRTIVSDGFELYGDGLASERIVSVLVGADLIKSLNKRFLML